MSVDILAIGNNNRKKQEQDMNTNIMQPAWIQKEKYYSENMMDQPEAKVTVNPLDRQVEIGVGAKITPMSKAQKQQYADSLSDYKRAMMQRYKAEGYSFEASKELVNQMDELANPNARGIDKYKDYEAKEQYYNRNGGTVDPDSTLYKVGTFLQKIGFNDQEKNPLNKLSQDYMQWYANEREAVDTIMEDEEANLAERFGWWLQRSLLSAEAGIIGGLGQIGNAVTGVEDIKQSAMTATLDRLIKGYDTDLDFYREDDRRLDEYLWEGASGGLNTLFWAWAPKIMTTFSALGETKAGEWTMEKADGLMKKIIGLGLKVPGISDYYKSLDEQGQEDMLDTLTTLGWMELAKRTGKWTGKMKISRKYQDIKNQFKVALDRGIEGAKEQAKAEVRNVKEATDLYNEGGNKIGSMGPEGKVGVGESINRIVKRGVDDFKQSFIDRYNARHGGTVAEPGSVEPEEPVVGKPNNESKSDGVIQKGKDIIQEKWTDITTGLTPEERIRIQNDPYVAEKFNKALGMINEAGMPLEDAFITEQLYNEIGDKIIQVFDEWENKLENTLPEYRALRELNTTYNLIEATPLLTDLLLKNDITQDPVSGELDFSNSKFVSDADMRSVQRAIDMIYKDIGALMTPRQYLNLRDKLDQLAKYTTVDASRGQGLIRQIRRTLDGVAKKQIPGLKELDDTTSKYFKEIAELKDGWVYKGGDRKGEIRNNFYSIIKNLTGQNRHVMLQRLEKYYPGVTEEIEAIHLTNKLIKAYNKAPQIVTSMGIGGAIGGGIGGISSGWAIVPSLLGAIVGELINKGIIEPGSKKWRREAINKLLSEMSPEAQAKLEEIARRQTYAKEISAEDQRILDGVAEIIIQERNRGLSEEAIRERERRTKPLDQEALPGIQPDIVDENGNITLGRGNVISPDKGPGRARRLTRINEINLKNPESTPDKQVLDLQEKLDIDTDTAREIQSTIDDFLKDVGANEQGTVGGREVNYEKFTTRSLEKLMDNENLPRTEKEKIKEILAKRGAEEEAISEVKADRDFAMRIKQLSEEEQRIGKVGKNKVSKEVADKQMREWEKKKEALIKEMQDYYGIDQFEASDKYLDMESKGDQYIREYKRSNVYKTETAEREVLDSLMEGWSKQPKFVRDMDDNQLKIRQDFLNNVELQNGYKLETTDYNDRYILEDNGSIVDRGAIKYLDDGTIEVTAQTFDGLKESGLLDYLPDNTEIKETGSDTWMSARELKEYPLADTWIRDSEGKIVPLSEVQNYYDFADKTPIDKFDGELTEQQIQEGKDLYQLASESLTPETENEIIEARGKFLTFNQRPGYTKALGLDQGEVNKTIMSWQRMSPELKKFVDKVHAKTDPKYRFMGMSNWIEKDNPWRGIDSLKFLTDDVKAVDKDPNIRSYELEIRDTLDGIMLGNSKLSYETLRIRLTHGEEENAFNKHLREDYAVGEFFPDIDMLVAGEGKETVRHEEGHYISSLLGRKILGNRKAFDKGVRKATSRDWERWWSSRYKSPEVGKFHEKILKLVESLDKSMAPQMKNDNRIMMPDGSVMKDYRARPDEKWARFWEASIGFTKKIAQTGKIPTKTFKSIHGDEYTLKQYENLIGILQEYQRLEDKGLFYEVEVPDETRVNMGSGLKDIQQQSLFDQEPEISKEEAEEEFKKEYDKLYNILDRATKGTAIAPQRLPLSLNDTYTPDLKEWLRRMDEEDLEDRKGKFNEEKLIDLYFAYLKMADNPKAMQLIRADKDEFHMKPYYELITKMKAQPLRIPEEFKNEQWIGPLRRALYEIDGTSLDDLQRYYDPDIVQWMDNLTYDTHSGITMAELRNIDKLLDDYVKNADTDVKVKGTFADDAINSLVEAKVNRERYGWASPISTYDKNQILKVARETEEILDRRLEQIKPFYTDSDGSLSDQFQDFKAEYIHALGTTYNPNVDKWHENIKKRLRTNIKKYEGFKIDPKFSRNFIYPHQLNSLKAKVKELDKYSRQDIQSVYEGTYTDAFMRAVKPKIEKLQARGMDKAVTDLIALSDMSVENFKRQINRGGKIPMPSIAVQDPNVPSGSFGELTVLFGKDTVDPKADKRNVLYGSDAWTPMFPDVKLIGTFDTLAKRYEIVNRIINPIMEEIGVIYSPLNFWGDLKDSTEALLREYGDRKDLNENADRLAEQMTEELIEDLPGYREYIDKHPEIFDNIKDGLGNVFETSEQKVLIPARYFDKEPTFRNIDEVANLIADYVPDDVRDMYTNNDGDDIRLLAEIMGVIERYSKDLASGQSVSDSILEGLEAELEIERTPRLEEIVRILELEEPGDRPLTPENVLEAMLGEEPRRKTYPGTFRDMIEIEGTRVDSLEDVRKRNFAKVYHGDRVGELGDLEKRYANMLSIIADEYVPISEKEATIPVVERAIKKAYDTDVDKFQKNMKGAYNFTEEIPKDILQRVIDIVEQGRKIPIRFSESKPERVVDMYKEVQAVLVPRDRFDEVKKAVKGTPLEGKIERYRPDDYSAPRSKKIKELQKKYGNIFFSMGGVVMPIAMLRMMMNGEDEGQA